MTRLAILTSHPIQYYGPLFRELANRVELHVFFAHRATAEQQAAAGFGTAFDWDVDLTSGYAHSFLTNVARRPTAGQFFGCDTPEIGARLSQGRFDAVLTLGWHLKSLLQGIWAAKQLGLPVLVRGDSQLGGPRGVAKRATKAIAYPLFLRSFDAALYVGQRGLQYYQHYRYPAERLFFSPHCIDTNWFAARATVGRGQDLRARLGIDPADAVVLFAGKLTPFKRPLDAVEGCFQLMRDGRRVHLMVAGSGELEGAIRARAVELGLPAHLLGFRNQTEMPAAYAAADVLILPSNGRETWGLVANEALACGTPIVCSSAAGCAPDLAEDGVAGQTYPMGDIKGMARALGRVLAHPPGSDAIASRSMRYSLGAAADGVVNALSVVVPRKTQN